MAYNSKDIIRIKYNVNDLQLFSICLEYGLDFRRVDSLRNFGPSLWIDITKKELLFHGGIDLVLAFHDVAGYTSKELKMLKNMKPVTAKRIKKDLKTAAAYLELVDDYPSLRMEKMDIFIKNNLVVVDDNSDKEQEQEIKTETKVKSTKKVKLDLDSILDKINESGINSLTKEEKEFLDKLAE